MWRTHGKKTKRSKIRMFHLKNNGMKLHNKKMAAIATTNDKENSSVEDDVDNIRAIVSTGNRLLIVTLSKALGLLLSCACVRLTVRMYALLCSIQMPPTYDAIMHAINFNNYTITETHFVREKKIQIYDKERECVWSECALQYRASHFKCTSKNWNKNHCTFLARTHTHAQTLF